MSSYEPKRNSSASKVRRIVLNLRPGDLITMRDLVGCGSRKSIDCAIGRLQKSGLVTAVARGVYMRPRPGDPDWRPSALEIARVKARAFAREVIVVKTASVPHSSSPALDAVGSSDSFQIAPNSERERETVLATVGAPSSFVLASGEKVRFEKVSARKFQLLRSGVGKDLYLLSKLSPESLAKFARSIGGKRKQIVKHFLSVLPAWMSDVLGWPWNHKWPPSEQNSPSVAVSVPSSFNASVPEAARHRSTPSTGLSDLNAPINCAPAIQNTVEPVLRTAEHTDED